MQDINEIQGISAAIHYPECWDTMAYPTLEHALAEMFAWWECSNEECRCANASPINPSQIRAARQVIEAAAKACERSDRYRGDYFAAKVRGINVLKELGMDENLPPPPPPPPLRIIREGISVTYREPDATSCTCPSGNGSLLWPCPQHPKVDTGIKPR